MNTVKIGQGFEAPNGDYCGIRLEDDSKPILEVRLSGSAAAVINVNRDVYGEVFDWIEQVAFAINSTGEVNSFQTIVVDSTMINDKNWVIKNWNRLIKIKRN